MILMKMAHSRAPLYFLVFSLCTLAAYANTTAELWTTAELLDRSCDQYCQNKIKDQQGCTIFCSFLDHVKKHDLQDIHSLYEEANRNPKPLEWAMEDTVSWKFQTKMDDDHEVAEYFMASTRNWIKYVKNQKEEL